MLAWLESTPFSAWIRGDSLWGWPLAITIHVIGTAVVIGFVLIINLRLLGMFRTIPFASLARLFPFVWAALVVQLVSGLALWMAKPTRYVADVAFELKFAFVVIGTVLMLYLFGTMKREAGAWDVKGAISSAGTRMIAPTLLAWCLVLVASRLTAFLGSLYTG